MSENKKKNAADNLPAASGRPVAQAGKKESPFKDGEQFIVIPFNRLPKAFTRAEIHAASGGTSRSSTHAAEL